MAFNPEIVAYIEKRLNEGADDPTISKEISANAKWSGEISGQGAENYINFCKKKAPARYMQVDLQDLTKLVVVCPNQECGAEIVFDLGKRKLFIRGVVCPVCNTNVLEVLREDRVVEFTWATFFQRLLQAEGKPRMFFRIPRAAR